jgi:hypothetical protein
MTMRHLIYIILVLLLTSCGTTYQLSTTNYDPIYSPSNPIKFDVISNRFQLNRKFRFDDEFRWNFSRYAMNQDLRWHYNFYFNNRRYRSIFTSPFDSYWNSNQFWWDWASNYSFNYGFNPWNRFRFYRYNPNWGYTRRTNTTYRYGRRSFNTNKTNTIKRKTIIRRNQPRVNINNKPIRDYNKPKNIIKRRKPNVKPTRRNLPSRRISPSPFNRSSPNIKKSRRANINIKVKKINN